LAAPAEAAPAEVSVEPEAVVPASALAAPAVVAPAAVSVEPAVVVPASVAAAPAAVVSVVLLLAVVSPVAVALVVAFVVVRPVAVARAATAVAVEHRVACSFAVHAAAVDLVEPVSAADSVAAAYPRSVRAVEPLATFEPARRDFEPHEYCLDCVVVNDAVPTMLVDRHWLPDLKAPQFLPGAADQPRRRWRSAALIVESAADSSVVQ